MKWYAKHIGKKFRLISEEPGHFEYKTREPAGYINFVHKKDAVIIDE